MPGWDDSRYVQQRVEDQEKRLKKLEAASIPFLAHQRGATPGAMRAVQIGDFNLKSNMVLSLNGNLAGVAPYQQVTDAAGTVRVEIGNLAARGISASQYGARVNDAGGNPIWDALGLVGAATLLGSEDLGSTPGNGSGTGFGTIQRIDTSGVNFTLTRQGNILVISVLSVLVPSGAGQALNYVGLWHGIWTQAGSLVTRKRIGASTVTTAAEQDENHFIVGVSIFSALSAGSLQLRQEFALDAATANVTFGGGATGVGPRADVIQLGG